MTTWSIVVAAGSGTRFGGPKQYGPLAGRRVIDHALAAARSVSDGVVLVVASDRAGHAEPGADVVVAGGRTRSDSTRAGLEAVPDDAAYVLVHDGARPLADTHLFGRVVAALAAGADAAIPVVDLVDSIRRRDGGSIDRAGVVAVQTPQGFRADILRRAHASAGEATDDATLVEAIGGKVVLVDGDPDNLKLTRPVDLAVAEALLAQVGR
ncbi:MAG TPA: 2-C-methyl-D-erythritol 4-phosphate cytidylyltransferase [Acidimicrobiales bacterium]|nr:2-C-methyl-D-erythritol 4-phosphate cytidylyltransferase [Acidimicrobiales bacterium]